MTLFVFVLGVLVGALLMLGIDLITVVLAACIKRELKEKENKQ